MPYIVEEKRQRLDRAIDELHQALVNLELDDGEDNNTEGNINYAVTRLLMMVYGTKDGTHYSNINDAIGLLECIKLEFYRKVAAPYEDQKEFDNGEIKPFVGHEPEIVGAIDLEIPPEVAEELAQSLKEFGEKHGFPKEDE